MLKGSPKENVLPQDATAWINYRIAPGDTAASVLARPRRSAAAATSAQPGKSVSLTRLASDAASFGSAV